MKELLYPSERTLGTITLVLGVLVWLALLIGTFGIALLFLAFGFLVYLFAQSALIASLRGNGVELTETQFPDLFDQFVSCCDRLNIEKRPECYVVNGNGVLNAFATRFLGHQYVVLNSDVVDAMNNHPDGLRFYIGHELAHLRRGHLTGQFFRWPVLWLPLIGAAYSRAKESTCDRHGAACCGSPDGAALAVSALSAGPAQWRALDTTAYLHQANQAPGFWMSFHELIAGYPWLTKRFARVMNEDDQLPTRNAFSYLPALFVPYAGRSGGGFAFLILAYIIGVGAAIAIPAYHDYVVTAKLQALVIETRNARESLANYYETTNQIPDSLERINVSPSLSDGSKLTLDPKTMVLTVHSSLGELLLVPKLDAQGHVMWTCVAGKGFRAANLTPLCRAM